MPDNAAARNPTPFRRALNVAVTLLTLALAIGLVTGASTLVAQRADIAPTKAERPALEVETTPLSLQASYSVAVAYRGQIEAGQRVDLGFEAGGTLTSVTVNEGDRLAKGAPIARLDTRALEANRAAEVAARDALSAQTELARRTAGRQRMLAAGNHASAQRLDEAELTLLRLTAEMRRADAAIAAIDIAIDKAVLSAPFDAIVGRRAADPGAQLAPGQPVVELFEAVAAEFRVGVPETIAATLTPGTTAEVDVGGQTYTATLGRIRSDIDPTTRTRDLVFALPDAEITNRALGSLSLTREVPGAGAWVPVTALSEGIRGLWTVFVVEDGTARREAVEVVHTDGARAFIRGHLADGAKVITSAPHRIADGQPVTSAGS